MPYLLVVEKLRLLLAGVRLGVGSVALGIHTESQNQLLHVIVESAQPNTGLSSIGFFSQSC